MGPPAEALRKLGYPATRGRGEILRILSESPLPLSPREILDRFPAPKPDASTIYRNLSLLVSLDLVRSVALHERSRRYEAASDGVHRPRVHRARPLPRVLRLLPGLRKRGAGAMRRASALLGLLVLAFPHATAAKPPELRVLTSFLPIYLFTRNVAGDAPGISVEMMLPAALGCPHDYAITPGDMRKVAAADLL